MDPILLLVMFILFAMGSGKGGSSGGGGKGAVGGFDPLPKPDQNPPAKPASLPTGGSGGGGGGPVVVPIPAGGGLSISSDCKTVLESPGWWQSGPEELAAQLVSDGFGLPIYTEAQAARSIDAVIRTIVAKTAGSACIDSAPWLDRWVQANPMPKIGPGQTREAYLQELDMWDDGWDVTISQWAGAHPQAFDLFRKIGNAVAAMWAGQYAPDIGTGPGEPGDPPPSGQGGKASPTEVAALRTLGYDITPDAAEHFQQDYNLLRNYQTGYGWRDFGLEIDTDGVVGPQTRTALTEALNMASGSADQWRVLVAGAHNG